MYGADALYYAVMADEPPSLCKDIYVALGSTDSVLEQLALDYEVTTSEIKSHIRI